MGRAASCGIIHDAAVNFASALLLADAAGFSQQADLQRIARFLEFLCKLLFSRRLQAVKKGLM